MLAATVEVPGPFKVEAKPLMITIEPSATAPDRAIKPEIWVWVLVVVVVTVVVAGFTALRKKQEVNF